MTTPTLPASLGNEPIDLDCRQLRSAAAILELARLFRTLPEMPTCVHARSDDADFPIDVRAWANSVGALLRLDTHDQESVAKLQFHVMGAPVRHPAPLPADALNAEAPARVLDLDKVPLNRVIAAMDAEAIHGEPMQVRCSTPGFVVDAFAWANERGWRAFPVEDGMRLEPGVRSFLDLPVPEPTPVRRRDADVVDLRQYAPERALVELASAMVARPEREVRVLARPNGFKTLLMSWCVSTGTQCTPVEDPRSALAFRVRGGGRTVPRDAEPHVAMLLLRDNLECLMAALLVADVHLSRGLDATLVVCGEAVRLLHRERAIPPRLLSSPPFLHRVHQHTLAAGRGSDPASGPPGHRIQLLDHLLQRPPRTTHELIREGAGLGARFGLCTMSLTVHQVLRRDVAPLDGLQDGGIARFLDLAMRSKSTLIF